MNWLEEADETLRPLPSLYLALAKAFLAGGDREAASEMLRQARWLVADQSSRVHPASLRESFLRNSRINREIQTMWETLGLSSDL